MMRRFYWLAHLAILITFCVTLLGCQTSNYENTDAIPLPSETQGSNSTPTKELPVLKITKTPVDTNATSSLHTPTSTTTEIPRVSTQPETISLENIQDLDIYTKIRTPKVWSVSWSPNSTKIAFGTKEGVSLYDVNLLENVWFISTPDVVFDTAFNSNGELLAYAHFQYPGFHLIVNKTGNILKSLSASGDRIIFSPNGNLIVTSRTTPLGHTGVASDIEMWNAETGDNISTTLSVGMGVLTGFSFSSDGNILATGTEYRVSGKENKVVLWDMLTQTEIYSFEGDVVAISPVDEFIVTANNHMSGTSTISIWDGSSYELITQIDRSKSFVNNLSFSPNGNLIAVGGEKIQIIDVVSGSVIKEWNGDNKSFVLCSPDGRFLVTYALSGKDVILWTIIP